MRARKLLRCNYAIKTLRDGTRSHDHLDCPLHNDLDARARAAGFDPDADDENRKIKGSAMMEYEVKAKIAKKTSDLLLMGMVVSFIVGLIIGVMIARVFYLL